MWNNGRQEPENQGGNSSGEERRDSSRQGSGGHDESYGGPVGRGLGMGMGAPSQYGFDAFSSYPHAGMPIYSPQHTVEQLHHRRLLAMQEQQAMQQQQDLEYARQHLIHHRQEEARVREAERQISGGMGEQAMQGEKPPTPAPRARGKPEALATALAAARIREENDKAKSAAASSMVEKKVDTPAAEERKPVPETPKTKKKRKPASSPRKRTPTTSGPSLDDPVSPITEAEYENIDALMKQFCRVPLLAEFSRPVSLLHPELMSVYSKIINHPMDLGCVCRAIRRRQYKDTRAIRLHMWRIFANCISYHSHPSNKDAVPSFVSIALHLREHFNALWQEHMIPSDPPQALVTGGKQVRGSTEADKREEDRKMRIAVTRATLLSTRCLEKTAAAIGHFVDTGGLVDKLDTERIFADDDDVDLDVVSEKLRQLRKRLDQIRQSDQEFTVDELDSELRKCYSAEDLFENKPNVRVRIGCRLDRLLGQIVVPIYEVSGRGVNQSSIWGCMAAAVWARESSKKPYWPALVLGIMAPEDQHEDWHSALTERNEQRLPEKLRTDLVNGKRKAEQALRRQKTMGSEQMSYFLVEFMGTHEFIWVRESDIIENFDPDVDPNLASAAGNITKKKRSSRSHDVSGTKTFASALEEGRWALEEFEMQLNDTCGDLIEEEEEEEDDEQEMNYSYAFLSQSDDEADDEDNESANMDMDGLSASDIEEANELLASDGLIDYTAEGRKNAKKRAAARKKKIASQEKAALKKEKAKAARSTKADQKKGKSPRSTQKMRKGGRVVKLDKREERELEKMRKKRTRQREKILRDAKRRRTSAPDSAGDQGKPKSMSISSRRGRSSAIVRGYLMRMAKNEDMKGLGVGNAMTIPSSALDSSGLLGMALAFRSAAGELEFLESDQISKPKPWDEIDVDGPKTSEERIKKLEEQANLLEAEISRLKEATAARKALTEVALQSRDEFEDNILGDEAEARQIIHERALKNKPKSSLKAKPVPDKSASADVDTEEVQAEPVESTNTQPAKNQAATSDEDTALKAEPSVPNADEDIPIAMEEG